MRPEQVILYIVTATILIAAPKEDPSAPQIAELRKKLSEYTDKTAKVNEKIAATKSEASVERLAHQRYTETFTSELARFEKEKSELTDEKAKLSHGSDSLAQKISSIQNSTHEFELRQEGFIQTTIEAVDLYSNALSEFPSPLLNKERESVTFLKRELSGNTISASEGIERLWQLIQSVNRGRLTIDTWQANSTWDKISGQVHYIRIGYAWLGVIDEQGTAGALWNGSSWNAITDPVQLTTLRTAVKMRSGNAVPALLNIPLAIQTIAVAK